ncbi:MAG: hypothetical protein ABSB99_08910 [Acidimicrobiales bacterium]
MPPSTRHQHGEDGASLILALVFMVVMSLLLLGLLELTGTALVNTYNLKSQRSLEYAADGAADIAVQNVRYSDNPYSASSTNCLPGSVSSITLNGVSMSVDCTQQAYDPLSGLTREVNFYACTSALCTSSNAVLQAEVTFEDYSSDNTTYHCSPTTGLSTCGTGMLIDSWVVETANH